MGMSIVLFTHFWLTARPRACGTRRRVGAFSTVKRSRNGREVRIAVLRRRTARRQLTDVFGERFGQGEAQRKPHARNPSW